MLVRDTQQVSEMVDGHVTHQKLPLLIHLIVASKVAENIVFG